MDNWSNREPIDAIATRTLEFDGKPEFTIRIGRPTLAPEGDCWFCRYELDGPWTKRQGRFGGEDAMQALVNALYCMAVDVEVCAENEQGRLSWLGNKENFGLPLPPMPEAQDKP
jgi:hypothetical protein